MHVINPTRSAKLCGAPLPKFSPLVENDETEIPINWKEECGYTKSSSSPSTHQNPYPIQLNTSISLTDSQELSSLSTNFESNYIRSCLVDRKGPNHAFRNILEGWSLGKMYRLCLNPLSGYPPYRVYGRRHHLRPNGEREYHRRGYFPGLYPSWMRPGRQRPADQDIPTSRQGVRGYAANPEGRRSVSVLQNQNQRRGDCVFMLL